ncbi:hypothetical protein [Brevundimonas sp. Root1423]|uniref:hypothetical protein n=1 Tax=Brevundimonas sp. Root1423 TaxID=1736462 RepID=UPI0006F805BA|nr:hypothetical protein [Brevundimonas sp. Root1423]KQY75304.1 hypothetical protein ASD25_12230 [Brevundimonas sp. Root1423]
MDVTLNPTAEQRAILQRLDVPEQIAVAMRLPSFTLGVEDARTVGDALTDEMARHGFDLDYEPTAKGRLIEDLIDQLFIP